MPFEPAGLVPALRDAAVVGLAAAIRTSRELNLATHTIARSLMLHAGFRAVHIERTTDTGADLDRYVVRWRPIELVRTGQGFLRTAETLKFVRWLREHSLQHPDDPVRVIHADGAPALDSLDAVEDRLADVDPYGDPRRSRVPCGSDSNALTCAFVLRLLAACARGERGPGRLSCFLGVQV